VALFEGDMSQFLSGLWDAMRDGGCRKSAAK
jgi:hypothetical protein